jgi:misacylated tRNA(Ala) deacylase
MTESLAQTDSYLKEFDARVLAVDRESGAVALDRSAFFPGGGGQPYDLGWLDDLAVRRVKRQGELIWHWLAQTPAGGASEPGQPAEQLPSALPREGEIIHGRIDWPRRYRLMRTHTAFHILCGVVWRDYSAQVTGGNMEELRGRMDFEFETLRAELVREIEEKINKEVAAAREVRVRVLPRREAFEIPDLIRTKINLLPPDIREVRVVEIEGLDLQADGGTHVANTREVGGIRVVGYKSKGRINKRIELALDVEQPSA